MTDKADHLLTQLQRIKESVDLECKLAAGPDGQGKLPTDFWATYSAFANTRGGLIALGLKEKGGQFEVQGLALADRVVKELFDNLNNRQKISANLLSDAHVRISDVGGKQVVLVEVPAAGRKVRPVYLKGNPFNGNTYRRLHEGDRHCDDETVKRMLAEQVEDSRDARILSHYTLADLDGDSLHAYRQALSAFRPNHPWSVLNDRAFLDAIGGWRRDRDSGEEGLTFAGLLMFGAWPSIQEAFPHYFLDYQEQADPEVRWLDRLVPDGSWSGNLYDFYRRVSRKLATDLKVPFALKDDIRVDDTLLHQALREALVNTLVHADYSDRASVQVFKRSEGFLFRNPGTMRVPPAQALQGGESDCRNRTLHQMFLMIGIGERAGSGLPKIRQGWELVNGRLSLQDTFEPYEQTRLELAWPQAVSPIASPIASPIVPSAMEDAVLALLRENARLSTVQLGERLKVSKRTILTYIDNLKTQGRLRRVGSPRSGHWELADEAES
ncbi:transcriptional regulator [Pseudomonas daroniae]|uniref:Transcriptional regulator n=1 Tax=Phytopseudomonas daroniae TaxID=2487519 RepID=A0A4Q9QLT2_9GAMM|nr:MULTISPECIES: RNA-binding domain-containing protein [Pseudomonas]TBU77573.1 transcriptional regulator [Pseudomonas daroniae]TBU85724.1 transcriptional regulator [Pseudomonas sp. FRB 228]TBU94887.1 transcriptional regulator [Pseudomonas daroniae]